MAVTVAGGSDYPWCRQRPRRRRFESCLRRTMTELIDRLAEIARIELSDKEKAMFEKDLAKVLDAFDVLTKADTKGIEPAVHPLQLKSIQRADKIEPCLSNEEALANTQHKEKGFVKGPKIL